MALPRLLPKPPNSPPTPEPQQPDKRRRGTNHTACNVCRARREKCSGERPRCRACERHGRDCVYAAPQGVTRQQANKQRLAEVERLSLYLRDIVDLLRQGSEADAALALRRIRAAEHTEEAVSILATAQALVGPSPAIESTLGPGPRLDETASSHASQRPFESPRSSSYERLRYAPAIEHIQTRDRYTENSDFVALPALDLDISRWTSVCKDNQLLNYLLRVFWSLDNMVEPTLFRPLFEEDLSKDNAMFCSPFLVNALLALSCLLTTEDATFSEPGDCTTRGRKFAEEAERHFNKEKHQPSIPLLQGQFAMFAYEGNLDGGVKAIDYFLGTVETYEALNNPDFLNRGNEEDHGGRLQRDGRALLDHVGLLLHRMAFGFQNPTAKPLIAKLWRNSTFQLCQPDSASYWWSQPGSQRVQRSMKVEIREANSYLSGIAEDVLDYLYPPSDDSTGHPTTDPQRAVELYGILAQWKLSLPARLRMEEAILPSAILLHSYVELLMGDILRPFSRWTKSQFGPFNPKYRCHSHCISLMETIWTFRAFTSLNGEYWYIPMLATVAFMTLRQHTESPMLTEALIKACKCLHEMTVMYPLASDALWAIRGACKRIGMHVPIYLQGFLESGVGHTADGLLHHAAAKLMPDKDLSSETRSEVRYQELLDELDDVELEGS